MRRVSMWLNLYGRQAVWHKLKKDFTKNAIMPTNMSTTVIQPPLTSKSAAWNIFILCSNIADLGFFKAERVEH